MGDVIDLVLVQANAGHEIDLNFVAGGQAAHQRGATQAAMLRHRQDRGNVVAGVRIIGSEICVVKIEFTHRHAIGPGGPLRREAALERQPKHRRARLERMRHGLRTRARDRAPCQRRRGHGGVVDDAVADHLHNLGLDRDRIGGHFGDLPRQLLGARQMVGRFAGADGMQLHDRVSSANVMDVAVSTGVGLPF